MATSTHRPIKIAPSILSADFGHLADEVKAIVDGGAEYVHVDVMDGRFVPNITIGPLVVEAVRRCTEAFVDVHLMIEEPEKYIDDFVDAGADNLTVHVEACRHLHRVIQQIKATGKKASVVLNPATPVESIFPVLDEVSMVLVMSVNPGFGGQKFIPQTVGRLRAIRQQIVERGLDVDIEIDGGIKIDNVDIVTAAGANVIVSGSGVFSGGPSKYAGTIAQMRERAERGRN